MLDISGPRVTFLALEIYILNDGVRTAQLGVARARPPRAAARARGTGKCVNFLTLQNKPPLNRDAVFWSAICNRDHAIITASILDRPWVVSQERQPMNRPPKYR